MASKEYKTNIEDNRRKQQQWWIF